MPMHLLPSHRQTQAPWQTSGQGFSADSELRMLHHAKTWTWERYSVRPAIAVPYDDTEFRGLPFAQGRTGVRIRDAASESAQGLSRGTSSWSPVSTQPSTFVHATDRRRRRRLLRKWRMEGASSVERR